jgi:hypothetical protein
MIGHGGLTKIWTGGNRDLAALLYHPQRPCANPAGRAMMNKQRAIEVGAASWLTD